MDLCHLTSPSQQITLQTKSVSLNGDMKICRKKTAKRYLLNSTVTVTFKRPDDAALEFRQNGAKLSLQAETYMSMKNLLPPLSRLLIFIINSRLINICSFSMSKDLVCKHEQSLLCSLGGNPKHYQSKQSYIPRPAAAAAFSKTSCHSSSKPERPTLLDPRPLLL